ncbi:uncharacterized protein LY79DRAFT_657922 [Colletotrichum navitas]|uniref:BCL5p n=1 Tax=Colletotrichum navitas TaxID=681940 RepID=A0AAD8Q3Y3_9PEZI|nr:uncharacterized protein LY79DRAFT_657922 [Colletotrichum navitas]KAK1595395.1 hypothetical protein LY79DRAFT_657922 [Colletotrichum navitas]
MSSFFLMVLRSIDPRRRQKSDRDKSAPKWRSTDTVFPVHAIDNTATLKAIVTRVTDTDSFIQSANDLEIHVPAHFSETVPAVSYTQAQYSGNIDETEDAEILQSHVGKARVVEIPDSARRFLVGPHTAMSLEDYVTRDIPLINLHVINYADATLVTLTWPHALTDGMGYIGIVKNWCKVLSGSKNEIEDLGGLHEDPLTVVAADTGPDKEPFDLDQKQLRGFGLFLFSIRSLIAWVFTPKIHHKGIVIPGPLFAHVKQLVLEQQEALFKDDPTKKPFISNGDILCSWLVRLVCSETFTLSNRSVVLMSAVDIRSRLQKLFKPHTVYAQNLLAFSYTFVPLADVLMAPLSLFARQIRESLMRQTSESQIYAAVRRNLWSISTIGRMPLYADPDSVLVVLSNLAKQKFKVVAKPILGLGSRLTDNIVLDKL